MTRGLYIAFLGELKHPGLKRKIESQIQAFKMNQIDIDYKEISIDKNYSIIKKILRRLPFFNFDPAIIDIDDICIYDFVYIRYFFSEKSLPAFIKKIKQIKPSLKIYIEFFDWPHDTQHTCLLNYPIKLKERYAFYKNREFFENAVTYTGDKIVFGIPTIHTNYKVNGLNVKEISTISGKKVDEKIHIIAVSIMKKYHGYDRLLIGLKNYVDLNLGPEIHIHFVGDGPQKELYHKIVRVNKLDSYVSFYGLLDKSELDAIYDLADLAVASLGMYRIGINEGSFIKTSEYLAKGLPVITGCYIDLFKKTSSDFYQEFKNDNSPINLCQVVKFYQQLLCIYGNKQVITNSIRIFAEEYCDIKKTLIPIINEINK